MSRTAERLGGVMAVVLGWMVLLPLGFVGLEAVRSPDGPSLEAVRRFASAPMEWRVLFNSLGLSVASVLGSAAVMRGTVACQGRTRNRNGEFGEGACRHTTRGGEPYICARSRCYADDAPRLAGADAPTRAAGQSNSGASVRVRLSSQKCG